MKIYVKEDEQYPVFKLTSSKDPKGTEVEVSKETLERWESIIEQYNQVQDEMGELYDGFEIKESENENR